MCGLAGIVSKSKARKLFPLSELKLLAMFQKNRGEHSTGILYNGTVTKGVDKGYHEKYGDPYEFFNKYYFRQPNVLSHKVGMIHNRFATKGARTAENAHPFIYEKDGVKHYFAHNGTLENVEELCTIYGLDFKDFEVDSKLLGHIIVNFGFDVLSVYTGAAAFLYYREDEPDWLYIWKGESRQTTDTIVEERPLYAVFTDKGSFVASTTGALQCALDVHIEDVIDVEPNVLIKLHNNRFENVGTYDRSHIPKKEPVYFSRGSSGTAAANDKDHKEASRHTKNSPEKELVPASGDVYIHNGIYKRNGHEINGEYHVCTDGKVVWGDAVSETDAIKILFYKGIPVRSMDSIKVLKEADKTTFLYKIQDERDMRISFFIFTEGGNLYYFPKNKAIRQNGKEVFHATEYTAIHKTYSLNLNHNNYCSFVIDTDKKKKKDKTPSTDLGDIKSIDIIAAPIEVRSKIKNQANKNVYLYGYGTSW